MAGSYPALYLSKFNPAVVLKGKLTGLIGEAWARKGLVMFQFTLSIMLNCIGMGSVQADQLYPDP